VPRWMLGILSLACSLAGRMTSRRTYHPSGPPACRRWEILWSGVRASRPPASGDHFLLRFDPLQNTDSSFPRTHNTCMCHLPSLSVTSFPWSRIKWLYTQKDGLLIRMRLLYIYCMLYIVVKMFFQRVYTDAYTTHVQKFLPAAFSKEKNAPSLQKPCFSPRKWAFSFRLRRKCSTRNNSMAWHSMTTRERTDDILRGRLELRRLNSN
jgi:hypothetical protein